MINISPKVTCGPKRRLPDGQMRTEEYKSSIWRRWSSRTFSTAAITLLNCRSLAEFISSNRLFSGSYYLKTSKTSLTCIRMTVRRSQMGHWGPVWGPVWGTQKIVPLILFLNVLISDWRLVVLIGEAFAIFSVFAISFETLSFTWNDQIKKPNHDFGKS